jgi:hypothetical protein
MGKMVQTLDGHAACLRAEQLVGRIGSMDRAGLVDELRRMRCEFPMDFTDEFLSSMSVERLKHIVLAASLHGRAH